MVHGLPRIKIKVFWQPVWIKILNNKGDLQRRNDVLNKIHYWAAFAAVTSTHIQKTDVAANQGLPA